MPLQFKVNTHAANENLLVLSKTPGRGAAYCDQFVCLCVCLPTSTSPEPLDRSSWNCLCISPMAVARSSSGGVAMLCTSGFMDDVTFGCNGPYGDAWKAEPLAY